MSRPVERDRLSIARCFHLENRKIIVDSYRSIAIMGGKLIERIRKMKANFYDTTDNFYQQEMGLTKKNISLEPTRRNSSKLSSNEIVSLPRALSSKPKASIKKKSPAYAPRFLPSIRTPNQPYRHPQPYEILKSRKAQQKLNFDAQILMSIRPQAPQAKSRSSRKQGLSSQALLQRKESHLNNYYNLRKQKLVDLTKANHRIYQRINSQTSLYSSRDLDKSFETNRSLSRRLSFSKLSKLSSRHSIISLSQSRQAKNEEITRLQPIKQPQDINTVQVEKMYRYLSIFCNNLNVRPTQQEKTKKQYPQSKSSMAQKQNKQTIHVPKLSKVAEEKKQKTQRRTNLQLARRL